jgi:hypothetical protein
MNATAHGADCSLKKNGHPMNITATLMIIMEMGAQIPNLHCVHQLTSCSYRYGQRLGPVQGVGYVNELLARLTGQAVQDKTQTNSTLDSSSVTFPLNRTFYADFSHDNQMISIYSALGLFVQPHDLDPAHPDALRTWFDSRLVPFSARMITEKLYCAGSSHAGEYVRISVSDAVQPLSFCGTGDGLCTLSDFVESQEYARTNGAGDWQLCF